MVEAALVATRAAAGLELAAVLDRRRLVVGEFAVAAKAAPLDKVEAGAHVALRLGRAVVAAAAATPSSVIVAPTIPIVVAAVIVAVVTAPVVVAIVAIVTAIVTAVVVAIIVAIAAAAPTVIITTPTIAVVVAAVVASAVVVAPAVVIAVIPSAVIAPVVASAVVVAIVLVTVRSHHGLIECSTRSTRCSFQACIAGPWDQLWDPCIALQAAIA